jgi:hypothetical protein
MRFREAWQEAEQEAMRMTGGYVRSEPKSKPGRADAMDRKHDWAC